MSVLFQPTVEILLTTFLRIYTTTSGIGQIRMNDEMISAQLYFRISKTDYYYYEIQATSNDTILLSVLNQNVTYSVSCPLTYQIRLFFR